MGFFSLNAKHAYIGVDEHEIEGLMWVRSWMTWNLQKME